MADFRVLGEPPEGFYRHYLLHFVPAHLLGLFRWSRAAALVLGSMSDWGGFSGHV
tara:strand:- start:66 stop:230 length:165 start_codon:yes stop_codon:yes gene_type:complete